MYSVISSSSLRCSPASFSCSRLTNCPSVIFRMASAWTEVGTPGGPGDLQGVSCAATVLCVAGNAGGNLLTSTEPAVASAWREDEGGASVQVTGVSCLASRQCAAVDNNGDVIASTDATAGNGSWSRTKLIPYVQPPSELDEPLNGLFGVSCVSASFCALVGADGQIFTSTDPFADPAPSKNAARHKRKARRPRITIVRVKFPSRRVAEERRARVDVRFYASGPVRRIECKVDRGHFHRCHSPTHFRVAKGTHALRIRAIGKTGLRGPTAVKRFWTGRRCSGRSYHCLVGGGELPPKRRQR